MPKPRSPMLIMLVLPLAVLASIAISIEDKLTEPPPPPPDATAAAFETTAAAFEATSTVKA